MLNARKICSRRGSVRVEVQQQPHAVGSAERLVLYKPSIARILISLLLGDKRWWREVERVQHPRQGLSLAQISVVLGSTTGSLIAAAIRSVIPSSWISRAHGLRVLRRLRTCGTVLQSHHVDRCPQPQEPLSKCAPGIQQSSRYLFGTLPLFDRLVEFRHDLNMRRPPRTRPTLCSSAVDLYCVESHAACSTHPFGGRRRPSRRLCVIARERRRGAQRRSLLSLHQRSS